MSASAPAPPTSGEAAGAGATASAIAARAVHRYRGGAGASVEDRVVVEAPLELRVSGKALTVVMRTPGHDEELALGFLYNEGVIHRAADVRGIARPEALRPDEEGNVIEVQLAGALVRIGPSQRSFYSSSSCGVCGTSSLAALRRALPDGTPERPVPLPADERARIPLRVSRAMLARLPERLAEAQRTFAETGGLHASGLFDSDGALIAAREDVGRHNALDKLIGWALGAGRLPLASSVLLVSGRVSYEILQKAIVAGLPLIAAVSAPSSLAVDLAERFGITLVGFLRGQGMNVYAHPRRIVDP